MLPMQSMRVWTIYIGCVRKRKLTMDMVPADTRRFSPHNGMNPCLH
jgi:hypothetical protein